jgi:hypothetical protein
MRSRTIGSSTAGNNTGSATADYTSIQGWQDSIAVTDSETGTIITSVAEVSGGANVDLTATVTSGRTILLTADSATAVNAPTYSDLTGKARTAYRLYIQSDNFTIEKIAIDSAGSGILCDNATTLKNIVMRTGSGQYGLRVFSPASAKIVTVSNVAVIVRGGGAGLACTNANGTLNIYHSSLLAQAASDVGVYRTAGTINCYGVIATGPGTCFSGTVGGDYNVSQDNSAPGSTTYWRGEVNVFKNVTSTTEDLSMYNPIIGTYAVPDYSSSADVGTDIAGTTRSAPRDAGCWQGGATVSLTTNLNHYFKFDNDLTDEIGATDLTNNNSATFDGTIKKLGTYSLNVRALDGANRTVTLSDANFNAPTTAMTIAFWAYSDASQSDKGLIGKGTSGSETFNITCVNANQVYGYIGNASGTGQLVSFGSPDAQGNNLTDEWLFYVLTYNGTTGVAHLFFRRPANANLKRLGRTTSGLPSTLYDGSADFEIGRARSAYAANAYSDHYFDGVGIWARELNGAEIEALYNAGSGDESWLSGGGPAFIARPNKLIRQAPNRASFF